MWWQWITKLPLSNTMFRHLEILQDREEKQTLRRSGCYAVGDIWPCPLWPYIPVTMRTNWKHPWPLGFFTTLKALRRTDYYHSRASQEKILIECCWSHSAPVQSPVKSTPWTDRENVSAPLSLRISRIRHSQDISMGEFSPTILNFGYDFFVLLLFWDTLYTSHTCLRRNSKLDSTHKWTTNMQ